MLIIRPNITKTAVKADVVVEIVTGLADWVFVTVCVTVTLFCEEVVDI